MQTNYQFIPRHRLLLNQRFNNIIETEKEKENHKQAHSVQELERERPQLEETEDSLTLGGSIKDT